MTTPNGIRAESAWIPVASIEVPTRHANQREIPDVSLHASTDCSSSAPTAALLQPASASMHARKRETS